MYDYVGRETRRCGGTCGLYLRDTAALHRTADEKEKITRKEFSNYFDNVRVRINRETGFENIPIAILLPQPTTKNRARG